MKRSRFSEEQIIGILKELQAVCSAPQRWTAGSWNFPALSR